MVKRTELCLHGACITVGKRQEGKNEERERGTGKKGKKRKLQITVTAMMKIKRAL